MSRNVPKRRWKAEEIAAVMEGDVPDGRTYLQAASYAHKHNIPWKELRKNKCKWWWRPEEDIILRRGDIVPNRSWESIRQHKEILGIPREAKPRYSDYLDYVDKVKNAHKPTIIPRKKVDATIADESV